MKKLSLVHLVILLCLIVFSLSVDVIASRKDGLLHVYLLDIGQGDAIFIETPEGNQVLIDGGPNTSVIKELGQIMPFYDRKIDVIVLTHPHADHVAGLVYVLKRFKVNNIVQASLQYDSSEFRAWQEAVNNEGANLIEAVVGKEIILGEDIALRTLSPLESLNRVEIKDPNNNSVVTVLDYKNFEMLLTGDMEDKEERQLLAAGINVDADILKLGHQGSKTSTTEPFLRAVSPLIGLISVGANNRYGHPHEVVIERLENNGIKYYRTDVNGRVEVRSDGEHFSIYTEK